LIGERGPSSQAVEASDRIVATLSSQRFGVTVTMSLPRALVSDSGGDLQALGLAITLAIGVVLLGLFIAFRMLLAQRQRENPIAEMERALHAGEFVPYYQPVVDIRSGRIRGAEVLLRWKKPDGTVELPHAFIPLAETSGLIVDLTRALMRRVSEDAAQIFGPRPHLRVGFNLTARHFADEQIVREVREIFGRSQVRLRQVILEVTERQPIEDLVETRRVIAALQGLGVRIAIDDVGTGHSGLSYMLKLGVDIIKIDKMFVDGLGTDRNSNTIIEMLIDLAQNLRMEVTAEGVENFEQVVHLRELGIRAAQGHVFAPPLPGSAFRQLVEAIDPIKAPAEQDGNGAPSNQPLKFAS
jgi:sensor c-di-GMP phosphodiesterase-like protein